MKSSRPIFLVLAAAAALAACSNTPPPACPQASILPGAAKVTKFADGPGRDLTDVVAEGEIVDIAATCAYDRGGVTVDLQVALAGRRGPADRSRSAQFDYFVAVADAERNILAKEVFRVGFAFPADGMRAVQVEDIEPRIPLSDRKSGPAYRIFVGFQLTPEELEWNRTRGGAAAR